MIIKEIYSEKSILDIVAEYSQSRGGTIKKIDIVHDKEWRDYGPAEHLVDAVKVVVEKEA